MIPVPKRSKPDKLPFFVTEWQFSSGCAKYNSKCMLWPKELKSIHCSFLKNLLTKKKKKKSAYCLDTGWSYGSVL